MTEEISEVRGVLGKYWDLFLYVGIWYLVYLQLLGASANPLMDKSFSTFYIFSLLGGMFVFGVIMFAFRWKYGDVLSLPNWLRGLIFIVWTGVVVMMTVNSGTICETVNDVERCRLQGLIDVPESMLSAEGVSKDTRIYNSAVYPAFGEDPPWLIAVPMLITFIVLLGLDLGLGITPNWTIFLTVLVIACVIAGVNFAKDHQPAYQENRNAYTGAFVFGTGQSLVYAVTGIFIPAQHGIHNWLVKNKELYGIHAFGYAII